jgi:hypothetical protein
MKNNEIRFNCETDFKNAVDILRQRAFKDIVRTRFYEKIFLLGFNQILIQIQSKGEKEALVYLLGIKK